MVIKVYVSLVSGNVLMKVKQEHIRRILDVKKIPYEEIDLASPMCKEEKKFMQEKLKMAEEDLPALPPQIFKDKEHRGDYDGFFHALEAEELYSYLDIDVPKHEVEYIRKLESHRA
ncbi:hypothetical protein CAPTEDRAFT_189435 [Capitella teleta]|uniref:SH3 domain-binding glutamic acid-rich-like protein n=1 Tax=Capitella teleta TaxID=283909 RepID=R7VGZ1_CAPTE|nr:hypothetical protein CAPTEDRAFT_189435 [Capitella teleta]|eukprot:ELU15571.1 hypothetical protein CAPTEDRAFT_189435 [Capitella teleta]